MASLISTTKFQPFSFERYMQPIQIYANLYEKQEAALDALDEKASKWEMLANMAGNEKTYQKYKNYADNLRAEADELSSVGLTPNSRRRIRELTNQYRRDVQPIEQAYDRWQELEKEQRVYRANNNFNVAFDNDYSIMKLDDLISNPKQSYTAINGDDVVNRTSALAKQALQSIIDDPEISEATKGLLKIKMQSGATMEELNKALEMGLEPGQTGDRAVDALLQVAHTINNGYKSNGAYNEDFMWRNISQGLYGGLGTTTYSMQQDPSYLAPDRQFALDVAKKQSEPVDMGDGVTFEPLKGPKGMYKKDGKYYEYNPNLYGEGAGSDIKLNPQEATNYSEGQIVSLEDGSVGIVHKDKKTGAATVSKLTTVSGYPDISTDKKGHYYDSNGELIPTEKLPWKNESGSMDENGNYVRYSKTSDLDNVNKFPVYWRAWDDQGHKFMNMYNYDSNHCNSANVITKQDKLDKILANSNTLGLIKEYISQVTGIPIDNISDEKAKDAVTQKMVHIIEDQDIPSRNHYRVATPNTPDNDTIKKLQTGKLKKLDDNTSSALRDEYNNLYTFITSGQAVAPSQGSEKKGDNDLPAKKK